MLFQKTITTHEYITNNQEVNWYFEFKYGAKFGYLVVITNGRIDYELRLEPLEVFEKIEKLKELLPKCWEGWNGYNFNHNYNFMTPEDMAMEEGDELDFNYKGAPCHY